MNIDLKAIVRITSNSIIFDWKNPFNKSKNKLVVGSGFFIDNEHILTCAHVVDNATKIYINIPLIGKEKHEIKLLSFCPSLDIALLKTVSYKSNTFLELADSDKVKYTDKVFVMGYPLGQDSVKYSSGIISGLQDYLFQTDAPINPGNSGGPLIDSQNKVIGINSSKITSTSKSIEGVGFSIPINLYKYMKEIMLTTLIIRKPTILMEFNNLDQQLWEYSTNSKNVIFNQYQFNSGYYIKKVFNKDNLIIPKSGDILLELDGKKIDNFGETNSNNISGKSSITDILIKFNFGETINYKIWSTQEKKVINVNYKLDFIYPVKFTYPNYEKVDYFVLGGMVLMDLTMNHVAIYKYIFDTFLEMDEMSFRTKPKVIISSLLSGSSILKNDVIHGGDLLESINGVKIYSLDDIVKAVNDTFQDYKGYLIMKNHLGDTFAIQLKTAFKETLELSNTFNFKWYNQLSKVILDKLNIKINNI